LRLPLLQMPMDKGFCGYLLITNNNGPELRIQWEHSLGGSNPLARTIDYKGFWGPYL
jgi:hypothetical protein